MKKIQLIILVVAVIAIVGAAYFGFSHITKSAPVATNQEPIKIGIVVYPESGAFYIAKEKKFFQKEGVDVELVQIPADNIFAALETNQVQMATGFAPDTMTLLADAGINVKQVLLTSFSAGADGMVASKEIKKITDLKNKKVYLTLGYPEHFFFRYAAEQAGLSAGDVELVNLNSEEVGASFVSGKINAGMTWEPWLTKGLERKDGQILFTSSDYPGVIMSLLVSRNDLIEKRPEDIKKIMRGFFEAAAWWENNTAEGNAIAAKNFNLTVEEFAPMRNTFKLADLKTNLQKFGKTNPQNIYEITNKASEYYFQDGIIKSKIDGDQVTDASLIQGLR
jgi:NitT/TauT family transport system substrate-binding protein